MRSVPKDVLECLQMAEHLLDIFQGELQRVEQDIKDREKELKATTAERDSAIIQKGIDRLVQEKHDVRQQLVTLHAQLASPAGEVLAAAPR